MRELTSHKVNGCNEELQVEVLDAPGQGNACHEYLVTTPPWTSECGNAGQGARSFQLSFQNGPIKKVGTNGITHEALLAILEDRLQGFQSGPYACEENAAALTAIQSAQAILKSRTEKRLARGVEGTHAV